MANNRELSQFASYVEVYSGNSVGIATSSRPYIGIGTDNPQAKLHVVGDIIFDGTIQSQVNLNNSTITNLSGTNLNYSGIGTIDGVKISSGIVTASSGIVTYYGDAQYLRNVGLAVTYIDNPVTIGGTLTVSEISITGGGGIGGGAGLAASTVYVTGISTLSGVQINAGIITAGVGTTSVKYYGDGGGLTNIQCSALTGFEVAIYRRPPTGRWTFGGNITKIAVAANDTFQVTARSGIVTVSIGDAALPPLTVK